MRKPLFITHFSKSAYNDVHLVLMAKLRISGETLLLNWLLIDVCSYQMLSTTTSYMEHTGSSHVSGKTTVALWRNSWSGSISVTTATCEASFPISATCEHDCAPSVARADNCGDVWRAAGCTR